MIFEYGQLIAELNQFEKKLIFFYYNYYKRPTNKTMNYQEEKDMFLAVHAPDTDNMDISVKTSIENAEKFDKHWRERVKTYQEEKDMFLAANAPDTDDMDVSVKAAIENAEKFDKKWKASW